MMRRSLDLHGFYPHQASALLERELLACLRLNAFSLTIIHGKGTGVLREEVLATLSRYHSQIISIELGEDIGLAGGEGVIKVHFKGEAVQPVSYTPKRKVVAKTLEASREVSYQDQVQNKRIKGRERYQRRQQRIKQMRGS